MDGMTDYECVSCGMLSDSSQEYGGACEDCYNEIKEDYESGLAAGKYYRAPKWFIKYNEGQSEAQHP